MSRTRHPRRGETRHRQSSPARLTKLGDSHYHKAISYVKADGNCWHGTVSDVGGDSRRRSQRASRENKVIGRRLERRRLKELGKLEEGLA